MGSAWTAWMGVINSLPLFEWKQRMRKGNGAAWLSLELLSLAYSWAGGITLA